MMVLLVGGLPAWSQPQKLKVGDTFPKFEMQQIAKSGKFSNESLKGKPAIVDFWASWCAPCKESFPFYDQMAKKYGKQGLVVIGVNVDDTIEPAQEFSKNTPVSFTLLFDEGKKLVTQIKVATMPTSYLIDRSGKLISIHRGFVPSDREGLEAEIKKLVGQP